jgi:hypothetical protein
MLSLTDIFEKQDVRHRRILAFIISIFLIAACSGSDKPEVETLAFMVDSTLLGDSFTDSVSGLTLQAPAHWQRLSDETVEQVQAGIQANPGDPGQPVPEILALFSLQEYNAHLVVGCYEPKLSPAILDSVLAQQRAGLQTQFPEGKVLASKFLHNQNLFEQLLVVSGDFSVIKLFVRREDRGMVHIEYVAHRSWYETHLRAIESSIGSISLES